MKFSKEQIERLSQNPNVLCVYPTQIVYSPEFRQKAVEDYLTGKTARQIFEDAGFNLQDISSYPDYASKILSKWRNNKNSNKKYIYSKTQNFKETKSAYQKLLARNEYLEAENEFLKKLQALKQQFL